jgi:hypothetical protein
MLTIFKEYVCLILKQFTYPLMMRNTDSFEAKKTLTSLRKAPKSLDMRNDQQCPFGMAKMRSRIGIKTGVNIVA